MNEKYLILERDIRSDLEILEEVWDELEEASLRAKVDPDHVIATGYRLHSLYNACENIFLNVARAFENRLDDEAGWHSQLLGRMRLDLEPIRPAVIDEEAYEKLDELKRFRHLFRAAYGIRLEPERMSLVLRKALELREILPGQIERFLEFLQQLPEDS